MMATATAMKTSVKKCVCAASNFNNHMYSILFNFSNVGEFF